MRIAGMTLAVFIASSLRMEAQTKSPGGELPGEVNRVLDYVLKEDYPEVYKEQPYKIRLRGFAVGDVIGDGSTEVFLLTDPHYHQSPPILIFQIAKDGVIRRLREGLAPGPLVPFTGDRMDAHTLGLGQDMNAVKGKTPDAGLKLAKALSKSMNVVFYRSFIHADMPARAHCFVDVSDRTEFKDADKCDSLQFSQPTAIALGAVKGGKRNPELAVSVGRETYLFEFKSITPEGFLEKSMTVIPTPPGKKAVVRRGDSVLVFHSDEQPTMDTEVQAP